MLINQLTRLKLKSNGIIMLSVFLCWFFLIFQLFITIFMFKEKHLNNKQFKNANNLFKLKLHKNI